jgi:hypothetical protein
MNRKIAILVILGIVGISVFLGGQTQMGPIEPQTVTIPGASSGQYVKADGTGAGSPTATTVSNTSIGYVSGTYYPCILSANTTGNYGCNTNANLSFSPSTSTLSVPYISASATIVAQSVNATIAGIISGPAAQATSSADFSSGPIGLIKSYWSGAQAQNDTWNIINYVTGNYPSDTATLKIYHSVSPGLSGTATVQVPSLGTTVYTVSTLPSASSAPAGTQVTVSDAATFTPGTCTGGGSDYMIAITNGSSWSCH